MVTHLRRWGNSLAVRIPKPLVKEAGLEIDSIVEITFSEGKLVIVPRAAPRYALEALLAQVTDQNRHDEVGTGSAVGVEAW